MQSAPYAKDAIIPGTELAFQRVLGEGGQGVVYLVKDTFLGAERVMKLMHPQPGVDVEEAKRTLQQEARAMAQLKSLHIVEVLYGSVTAEKPPRPYFTMPLLEGYTLSMLLKRERQLAIGHALLVAIEVLEGLSVAHSHPTHPLVHRDVKPSNIFLHRLQPGEWVTKILDFGVARDATQAPSKHSQMHFTGTCEYAAPEQAGGAVTFSADLYAVSAVLFQMLTGNLVFKGFSVWDTLKMHRSAPAPRVSTFVPVPHDLDDLVASGLEKDPKDRPRSAAEYARKLKAIRDRLRTAVDPQEQAHTDCMPLDRMLYAKGRRGDDLVAILAEEERPAQSTLFSARPAAGEPAAPSSAPDTKPISPNALPVELPVELPRSLAHADTQFAPPSMIPSAEMMGRPAPPTIDRVGVTRTHYSLRGPQIPAQRWTLSDRTPTPAFECAPMPEPAPPAPPVRFRALRAIPQVVRLAALVAPFAFLVLLGAVYGYRAGQRYAQTLAGSRTPPRTSAPSVHSAHMSTTLPAEPPPAATPLPAPSPQPAPIATTATTATTAQPVRSASPVRATAPKSKWTSQKPPGWMPGFDGDDEVSKTPSPSAPPSRASAPQKK